MIAATTIQIPRTLTAAKGRLTSLDNLVTASGWERAAIVWAFTYEGVNRFSSAREVVRYSIREFAAQGIKGLTSQDTVRAYRKAWKIAMEQYLARDVGPGQRVVLPTAEFPPVLSEGDSRYLGITDRDAIKAQAEADGTGATKALDIAKNQRAMAAAIKASPAVAKAAMDALTPAQKAEAIKEPEVADAVVRNSDAHLEVIRASGRRQAAEVGKAPKLSERKGNGLMEPLTRLLTLLGIETVLKDIAQTKAAVVDFTGTHVWRPREKEGVIAKIDLAIDDLSAIKAVLTAEVKDDELNEFIKGGK